MFLSSVGWIVSSELAVASTAMPEKPGLNINVAAYRRSQVEAYLH